MWRFPNFQFLSEEGPMEMGQFWVPQSAVGHNWSNFQPFSLEIWTVHMISRYLHLVNIKFQFEANWCPFWGADPFWGTKNYDVS